MANPVHKHLEDDGVLSIFVSGNAVVISCEFGHYWVVEAKEQQKKSEDSKLELLVADGQLAKMKMMLDES